MAWAAGGSVTGGSIATSLQHLFVFGSTDAGKNLVTNNSYTATLQGSAAYGSDSIGTYVEVTTAGRLDVNVAPAGDTWADTDYTWFITYSREGAAPAWSANFMVMDGGGNKVHGLQRDDASTTQSYLWENASARTVGWNYTEPTLSTEFTVVVTRVGTTLKLFRTGGSGAITATGTGFSSRTPEYLLIGGWNSGEYLPCRFRAYGRWGRALSDSEAQSLADNPQQMIAAAAPTAPSGVTAGSITATGATISWTDASSDETGFKVETAPSPYSSWTAASGSPTAANATSLAVTGLQGGTTYKARVASTNANGDSAWVESGTFTTASGIAGRALLLGVG